MESVFEAMAKEHWVYSQLASEEHHLYGFSRELGRSYSQRYINKPSHSHVGCLNNHLSTCWCAYRCAVRGAK